MDYIVHHVGYDERRDADVQAALGGRMPNPLDELKEVVAAVTIPVQAVGGLSLEQAVTMPLHGAPLVVDADAFTTASHDLETVLTDLVRRIRENGKLVPAR